QTETQYDINSNPTLITSKARFHDELSTGALEDYDTSPKARVSHVAAYYDVADRLSDTLDVGTNGGLAYTRPSSPPLRSDTELINGDRYKADEIQTEAHTGSPAGGTFKLKFYTSASNEETQPISHNASASALRNALQNVSLIGN